MIYKKNKKRNLFITGKETNKDAFMLIKLRLNYVQPLPPTLCSPSIWVLFLQQSTLLAVWNRSNHCANTKTWNVAYSARKIQLPQQPEKPMLSRITDLQFINYMVRNMMKDYLPGDYFLPLN